MTLVLLDPYFRDPFTPHFRWIAPHWTIHWDAAQEFNLLLSTDSCECLPWEFCLGSMELMPYEKFSYGCCKNGDVCGFCPYELKVKVDGDDVLVQGKHRQKDGIQAISRFFVSHFQLPEDVDRDSIRCDLDEKGRLQIYGQKKLEKDKQSIWDIPIDTGRMFHVDEDLDKCKN